MKAEEAKNLTDLYWLDLNNKDKQSTLFRTQELISIRAKKGYSNLIIDDCSIDERWFVQHTIEKLRELGYIITKDDGIYIVSWES